ncbi:MAG: 1-deoxy-D-xylulose-5-phosphate synthase [Bacteroidota bacterium]|nr:1-deoxy-D-xylulose-5-phosphate synthase [Bacteroidota bacterium]
MSAASGKILSKINDPYDIKKLSEDELPQLCKEVREYIIDEISHNPGHLGASLGAVELAVAIHYVFDTPYDKVIWDVGHQAYAHKILTGRREVFHTNRTYKGISGFPKMSESKYDAFGTGHASTSISAALGMAVASQLKERNGRQHIAIIGDGSMTGGMAMEALNNAGVSKANLLVILNDNGIAIDKNVGAIRKYLADITTSKFYNKVKDKIWFLLGGGTKYGANTRAIVKQFGNAVKSTILNKSNLFEAYNFRYFGPLDGHNVNHLVKILKDLKRIQGPRLLHVITVKGKGFKKAEEEQTKYHSPGHFDKETGNIIQPSSQEKQAPRYQTVFGRTIVELAEKNEKIVGITPAMPTGSSLNIMIEKMPERAFDVGIAEQHAVTFSAGLATQGYIPFCNIYSSFMQRAYDQLLHDVAIQNLHVVFCLDRGGIVGEDGATHHGVYDLAYLRTIPNIIIASPLNEEELRHMMYTAQLDHIKTIALRYPKGRGVMPDWKVPMEELEIGKGRLLREGKDIAVISIGHIGNFITEAGKELENDGISIAHYDMRFLKPIDEAMLRDIFSKFDKILSVEDGSIIGGLGSAVLEFMADNNFHATVKRLGVPDRFIEQGTQEELYKECGYDKEGIKKTIKEMLGHK